MKFSLRRDLGLQLLALYILFVGPVVLASLAFDHYATTRLEKDIKAADLSLARAIAQETNSEMDSAIQAVRQLALYPDVVASNNTGMEKVFRTMQSVRPDVNLFYRLNQNGIMVYHYPEGPTSTVGWDFSGRDYFVKAKTTRNPLLSQGRKSPTTDQPVATAVMPLWSEDGRFLGVVATNIKLQTLSHTLASIAADHDPGEGFEVAILDSSGQVIAHPSPPMLLNPEAKKPAAITQAVLSGHSGSSIEPNASKVETLFSYVPITSAGWGVIVSRPTEAAFATPTEIHRGVLFTVAVFLVIGLFFWIALSRQVIRPLERLAAFSQTIGLDIDPNITERLDLGNLSDRPDQIGHLIRSLERMEEAIEARLKELSTLLETSAAVVSSLNTQVVLNRILEQVERLMGIRMCAILALDEDNGVFRTQASRGLSQRYADQLAINPSEPHSVTIRAIRSGEPVQVSDTEADSSFTVSRPRARSEGYRSLLAVPLKSPHAPPSALLVYRPDPHVFSQREIDLLASFANHAAMAIENALLYARSDMRLHEQTRRLEALIQSFQDGLILEDLGGRVLYANRRMSELADIPYDEMSGVLVTNLIERFLATALPDNPEKREKLRQEMERVMQGKGSRTLEMEIASPPQPRYYRLQIFDVTDSDGALIGRGQILRDITRNREIDRMKSSLISTVSHELRTPLAAIKGYVTTLLAEDVQWDSASQHEFLNIIQNETDRLSSLVNDLLDMSRIEAGNLVVSHEACNLEELILHAAQCAHPSPLNRLRMQLPPSLPVLYADPQRVEVVLRNLLENAAKYAGGQTPITVSATIQAGNLEVRVEDEGPGIPPEDSQRIFESFYRVENGLTRTAPGAGLGLAICQGFVRAHGGEVWIEPRLKGTCVAFSLPLKPSLVEKIEPAVVRPKP